MVLGKHHCTPFTLMIFPLPNHDKKYSAYGEGIVLSVGIENAPPASIEVFYTLLRA